MEKLKIFSATKRSLVSTKNLWFSSFKYICPLIVVKI